ncbi:MAG: arginine-tRNA-protein transferase [Akkermansiaceae bacterium]|nr:arginine-tRNA-protein transferase [Akkermansiaceae bacterium]NNM30902.1 arginine-tRNA-protein transferase [Akkermansiaceae bacterium]
MSQSLYGTYPASWPLVAEGRHMAFVDPKAMDELWAAGWRQFGTEFFRASLMADEMCLKRQVALRVRVPDFAPSKSQRRTMRRNRDLEVRISPARPGPEEHALFAVHKTRFERNVPSRLEEFLGDEPDGTPCRCMQVSIRRHGELLAASFLALGKRACSSVYAVFNPGESNRRLGIFTMLLELDYAREQGMDYCYTGYATIEPSCYDYKKQFGALEYFEWDSVWRAAEEMPRCVPAA